jgi:hypothetical protein
MHNKRIRFSWWSSVAIVMGLVAGGVLAKAQPPDDPAGQLQVNEQKGLLHRWFHHTAATLQDKMIGYPENFIEPPLGHYVKENMSMQVAKADPHRFTLYRTDFLPGTDRFSPVGAYRFNLMYSRVGGWLGPVIVEWTPDEPGLAEARRQAVLVTMQTAGRPIVPERVVIGPSPYPGGMGTEAGNNFNTIITRSQQAALSYPPTPQNAAYTYGGGRQ